MKRSVFPGMSAAFFIAVPWLVGCDPKRAPSAEPAPAPAEPGARVATNSAPEREDAPSVPPRRRLLSGTASDFGIERPGSVWAVAMDMATDAGTATVIALSDGNASLHTKTGFDVRGGVSHQGIRDAAIRVCAVAARHVNHARPTTDFPYPDAGQIHFYFMTPSGPRRASADESALRNGEHALFELFFAAHALISELRQLAEAEPSS